MDQRDSPSQPETKTGQRLPVRGGETVMNKTLVFALLIIIIGTGSVGWMIGAYQTRWVETKEVVSTSKMLDAYVSVMEIYYDFEMKEKGMGLNSMFSKNRVEILEFESWVRFLEANGYETCYYTTTGKLGAKMWIEHDRLFYYWKVPK